MKLGIVKENEKLRKYIIELQDRIYNLKLENERLKTLLKKSK